MFYLRTVTLLAITLLGVVLSQSVVRRLTSTRLTESQIVVQSSSTESSSSPLACANFCANTSLPLPQDDCSAFYIRRESQSCHCGFVDASVIPSGDEETVFMHQGTIFGTIHGREIRYP